MSGDESEVFIADSNGQLSIDLSTRPRRSQRIDYHLLNDGSDEEAEPEDHITKKPRLNSPSIRSISIEPEDSASQLPQNLPTSGSFPQQFPIKSLSEAL